MQGLLYAVGESRDRSLGQVVGAAEQVVDDLRLVNRDLVDDTILKSPPVEYEQKFGAAVGLGAVFPPVGDEEAADGGLDSEFFVYLALCGLVGGFAILDVAAGDVEVVLVGRGRP